MSMFLLAQFIDGCGRPCAHACSSWTRLTCPLLCIAKCAVFAVMSLTPLSWRSGFLWSVPEILLLQYYCTCKAVGDSRAPTVAALTRSLTCPSCSTTKARGSTCRKLHGGRCPCCAGRVGAAFCGYGRPVVMQRQVYSLQKWRC